MIFAGIKFLPEKGKTTRGFQQGLCNNSLRTKEEAVLRLYINNLINGVELFTYNEVRARFWGMRYYIDRGYGWREFPNLKELRRYMRKRKALKGGGCPRIEED